MLLAYFSGFEKLNLFSGYNHHKTVNHNVECLTDHKYFRLSNEHEPIQAIVRALITFLFALFARTFKSGRKHVFF